MKIIAILLASAALFNYVANNASPTARAFLQNLQDLAEIEAIADKLRDILVKSGVKFSADQVEWAMTSKDAGLTNDINTYVPPNAVLSKSHIIFLERGNSKAGLEHIVLRHAKDFQAKDGINTVKQIIYKKGGLNLVYKIQSNNYLRVVIGSNGFIVTAYPSSSP